MQTAPTEEEFTAWLDHPVTSFVLKSYERMAEEQKEAWMEVSWAGGHCDSFELCALRTRADAYQSMAGSDLSDFIAANGGEVPDDPAKVIQVEAK